MRYRKISRDMIELMNACARVGHILTSLLDISKEYNILVKACQHTASKKHAKDISITLNF